jgi:DNA-binding transcriptional MerR regulator/methylmalonyl-CoA mutase cobalamin-binding subunit
MYTIKQAATRSGLSVPTVRVWERRYGVVHPQRTPSGYRLYDEDAINRLVAMRYLVDVVGLRPSQAAEQLRDDSPELEALLESARAWWLRGGKPEVESAGGAPESANGGAVASLVTAARSLDTTTLTTRLDEAFAAERFEAAIDHVVFPALRAIGDAWADGSVDVAMEHAASEVVRRRLSHFYDAAAAAGGRPDVIVGLPPGSQHDIGILAFGVAARRAGLAVLYLGANVPIESWARAVAASGAPAVVLGVVTLADVEPAARVVAGIRGLVDGPRVLLGGAAAGSVGGVAPADVLPDVIEDAVAVVARLVGRGP